MGRNTLAAVNGIASVKRKMTVILQRKIKFETGEVYPLIQHLCEGYMDNDALTTSTRQAKPVLLLCTTTLRQLRLHVRHNEIKNVLSSIDYQEVHIKSPEKLDLNTPMLSIIYNTHIKRVPSLAG
jgi:hypothetical protein